MKVIYEYTDPEYFPVRKSAQTMRYASRAIIRNGDKIYLLRNVRDQIYTFPGGGKQARESNLDTLIREVAEETGFSVIPKSIKPYGMTIERRLSIFNHNEMFIQKSYFYECEVENKRHEPSLETYERELGYRLCLVTPQQALEQNLSQEHKALNLRWLVRDNAVLKHLSEH